MSTYFYHYWLPVSIVFHLILLFMFRISPVEVQQQANLLNVISVSWELNIPKPEQPIASKPIIIPAEIKPVVKKDKKNYHPQNTTGNYWGQSQIVDNDNKQPVKNNSIGKTVKTGKLPNIIKSSSGKQIIPIDSDSDGTGTNRYGNNSAGSGMSSTAAKSGDSGDFSVSFSKNEEDFSVRFQITVINGKISRIKQFSSRRSDAKDEIIRDKIMSGAIPVNPDCESDKMTVNIKVTGGNHCRYRWE